MSRAPSILLVNPWITDFAAHDLWAKPVGLLLLGGLLREGGCGVALLDCLDRHDPETVGRRDLLPGRDQKFGCGKYPKLPISTPECLRELPRRYYRYGIHEESLRGSLSRLARPDLIWITSVMTYWYPGLQATIRVIREVFSDVPIWLGGIYARLCTEHARRFSGADRVVADPLPALPGRIEEATGFAVSNRTAWQSLRYAPLPALDLWPRPTYAPLMTSLGCPYHCSYCASNFLDPVRECRTAESLYDEIQGWRGRGIADFAFHDDALLIEADDGLRPVLTRLARENTKVRFHTPNGLHIRALTAEWCQLLFESGFVTIRLGLETTRADQQRRLGGKVDMEMFWTAIERLFAAGFTRDQIGVYLLCGLPGQTVDEVAESIAAVAKAGAQPRLSEYSPVPGTALWEDAVRRSTFALRDEPLTHNNSFFACRRADFSYDDLVQLKGYARQLRRQTRTSFQNRPKLSSYDWA